MLVLLSGGDVGFNVCAIYTLRVCSPDFIKDILNRPSDFFSVFSKVNNGLRWEVMAGNIFC